MQKTLESKYARYRDYKGSLTTRDLHMLRECKPTTVYVELGNIRNEFDRKRLMIKNNRQAIAAWLAEGFMSKWALLALSYKLQLKKAQKSRKRDPLSINPHFALKKP